MYYDTDRPQGDEELIKAFKYEHTTYRHRDRSIVRVICPLIHFIFCPPYTASATESPLWTSSYLFFSSSSNQPSSPLLSSPHHTQTLTVQSHLGDQRWSIDSAQLRAPVGHKHRTHESHSCYLERVLQSIPARVFVIGQTKCVTDTTLI